MTNETIITVAGLGGQGVLAAARILGEAAFRRGLPVVVSQLHGMSQRGGAVEATVSLYGRDVAPSSRIDVLVSLELLEALRLSSRLRPGSVAVVSSQLTPPPSAPLSGKVTPTKDEILTALRSRANRVSVVDAGVLAIEAGSAAAANLVMLGTFCALPGAAVAVEDILSAIDRLEMAALRALAPRALALGYRAARLIGSA
ncbi:MAG: 2-oxoacid:acceptor oxidoreductase family protein [Deltaproteobacteria bacterium]|nr:2-oxoacid:acceptor oxidoreductase family protein [Deltaproteobacteria bacterium]